MRAPINPEEQTFPFESNKGIAKTFFQKVKSEIRCNKDSTYMHWERKKERERERNRELERDADRDFMRRWQLILIFRLMAKLPWGITNP